MSKLTDCEIELMKKNIKLVKQVDKYKDVAASYLAIWFIYGMIAGSSITWVIVNTVFQ